MKPVLMFIMVLATSIGAGLVAQPPQPAPLALDVAQGDQEITLFGARGQLPPGTDRPSGDGLGKIAKGDFNGDGIPDLAVGVPQANPERGAARGAVYLIFGRPGAEAFPECRNPAFRRCFDAAGAVGPLPDVVINGSRDWWYLGETVGSGDLNGDGFDEVLVGAATGDGRGSVFAIFGRPRFPARTNIAAEGQKLTIRGAHPDDWLVIVARQSRDVNGDGIDDFLFAAPLADPGGRQDAGSVYILFGSPTLLPVTLSAAGADVIVEGRDAGDFLGAASSTAGAFFANSLTSGDLDGDGISDVALGSSGGDGPANERENSGEVYVLFGRPNWPQRIDLAAQAPDVTIYGAEAGDTLSAEYGVYTADLNGDGEQELLLTAPHAHGPDEEGDGQPNDRAQFAGEAYVLVGRERADWPTEIDLCVNVRAPAMNCPADQERVPGSGLPDLILFGAEPGDLLGKVIAGGDTDGDGLEDLIVSARWSEGRQNARHNTGEAYVLYGRELQVAEGPQDVLAVDTCLPQDFPEVWNCGRRRVAESQLPDIVLFAREVGISPAPPATVVGDGAYFVEIADLTNDGLGDIGLAANWADGPANDRADAGELYLFLGRPRQGR